MTSLTASFRILFLIVVRAVYTIKYTCMHQLLLIHSFIHSMISLKIGAEYDFFRKSQIKILCWIAPKTFFGNLTDYASSFGGWGRKII